MGTPITFIYDTDPTRYTFVPLANHLARWATNTSLESSQIIEINNLVSIPMNVSVGGNLLVTGNISGSSFNAQSVTANSFSGDASQLYNYPSQLINLIELNGNTFNPAYSTFYFPHNLNIAGTLTAREMHVGYISSSILYDSGSTKFGDSADDTHIFTGSVLIDGSLTANGLISAPSFSGNGSQITNIPSSSLPANIAYTDQFNSFAQSQTITGSLWVSDSVAVTNNVTIGSITYRTLDMIVSGTTSIPIVNDWNDASGYFMDYSLVSGSQVRTGIIRTTWITSGSGDITHNDFALLDIGLTDPIICIYPKLHGTTVTLDIHNIFDSWSFKAMVRII